MNFEVFVAEIQYLYEHFKSSLRLRFLSSRSWALIFLIKVELKESFDDMENL